MHKTWQTRPEYWSTQPVALSLLLTFFFSIFSQCVSVIMLEDAYVHAFVVTSSVGWFALLHSCPTHSSAAVDDAWPQFELNLVNLHTGCMGVWRWVVCILGLGKGCVFDLVYICAIIGFIWIFHVEFVGKAYLSFFFFFFNFVFVFFFISF